MVEIRKYNGIKPDKEFSELAEWWITQHWNWGIGIPEDFEKLSLKEKIRCIDDAQEGDIWQPCASLAVEVYDEDDDWKIAALQWESGSRRGAMLMDARSMIPWIIMVDAGTSSISEFHEISEKAQKLGFDASIVTIGSDDGRIVFSAKDVLGTLIYCGRAYPIPLF